jgi:hypothetical protein
MNPEATHLDLVYCVKPKSHLIAQSRLAVVAAVALRRRMIEEFAKSTAMRWRQKWVRARSHFSSFARPETDA